MVTTDQQEKMGNANNLHYFTFTYNLHYFTFTSSLTSLIAAVARDIFKLGNAYHDFFVTLNVTMITALVKLIDATSWHKFCTVLASNQQHQLAVGITYFVKKQ